MESEFPGINRLKIVVKNILLGSLGTQQQAAFAKISFLKKQTNFLNQTVTLKCIFHVKQYSGLIYVNE